MTDPDLSGLKAELALMDARMGDLLAKLPEKHSNETWSAVGRQILAATAALESGESDDAVGFLANADEALSTIRSDGQIWKEIHETVAERRRLAVEEQKREIALDGTVTAAQFDLVVGAMGASVNEEINSCIFLDEDQKDELLAAVGARFAQTLRYPILEPDTPIPDSILDTHLAIEPAS